MIEKVVSGYNATIFAYVIFIFKYFQGQTGSGKTYTIEGP